MAEVPGGLEALRGLHAAAPGLLEDAVLWGALGLGLAVGGLLAYVLQRRFLAQRQLRREALAALAGAAKLSPPEALRAQALVLRRLARTVAGDATMALQGAAWLAALDRLFATTFFTAGGGRCFGDGLYAADAPAIADIQSELARLVARLRWRP